MKKFTLAFPLILVTFCLFSCKQQTSKTTEDQIHFTLQSPAQTGITFNNTITENDSINLIENEYTYMGAGVGIGDFNNDDLPDVFFTANQKSSELYINKGNFKFENVTQKAGITTDYWGTGASIVDINGDGYDDIYVCVSETRNPYKRKNHLYVNNKNLTFSDKAEEYGLADTNYSTQAAFLDYDKDGDLDMYLLNHRLHHSPYNQIVKRDVSGKSGANDKLYENVGISPTFKHPVYKDATMKAGIKEDGYGLGIAVSDFNNDNWPDIYVCNDYIVNDVLWLNNHDGTFTNTIATSLRHQSYSSMGVDAADINNDELTDVATLDMLPETNERKKMMYSFLTYERYEMERRAGYEPEFMRNMLQLNNGTRNINNKEEPFFSEIGQLAGTFETDWSWSVLLADFDNDGWRDMHVTNGMGRDMLNNDFVAFRGSASANGDPHQPEQVKALISKLNEYGSVEMNNYCFRNNGNLTFSNVSENAGINTPAISNGCAYADLDNDGDLDLVVNNINRDAFVFRNDANNKKDSVNNYIKVKVVGDSTNLNGFGVKMKVFAGGKTQVAEEYPVRGFLSTVDKRLHFGIGNAATIDSILIIWPNDKLQVLKNIAKNQTITVKEKDAISTFNLRTEPTQYLFADITSQMNIDFKHQEKFFYDFGFQQLLPQKYSQLGPFITEGDINGDGLTDFFVGGAYQQPGRFFIQQNNGAFLGKDLVSAEKEEEDLGCLLFDADGDKDLDLFVNSGGYEFDIGSPSYRPRLYNNDGKGNFTFAAAALPTSMSTSAQCVGGSDFDSDGDIDIFIGGRVSPNQYPVSPRSYFLQNNNGRFT
ncbi:MAG TPA: VCBS repeat-containing protein, partial [Segetibacter sp.]